MKDEMDLGPTRVGEKLSMRRKRVPVSEREMEREGREKGRRDLHDSVLGVGLSGCEKRRRESISCTF